MAEQESQLPKAKKSVALSGTAAGNTALCTVGRTGNDLHYRGYDILDFADHAEFEEIAHLLIHGHLPTRSELAAYKKRLQSLRPSLQSRNSPQSRRNPRQQTNSLPRADKKTEQHPCVRHGGAAFFVCGRALPQKTMVQSCREYAIIAAYT